MVRIHHFLLLSLGLPASLLLPARRAQGAERTEPGLPELAEPLPVQADGRPIGIGHCAPAVVDFDKDGRKDLVVGRFKEGRARVYLNVGTDEKLRFKDFSFLKAGGEIASVPPS